MNLSSKQATHIKENINIYIGDILDKEKIKISDSYIVIGNLESPDIICTNNLIVIGNVISDTVFINGDLICIGKLDVKEEIILGEKKHVSHEVFSQGININNEINFLQHDDIKENNELAKNLVDKGMSYKKNPEEILSNNIELEIAKLNLISSKNENLYSGHNSIMKEIEVESDRKIEFFKFNECLYFRVSQMCELLNTYTSKIKSEMMNMISIGYVGKNKNGINFCRIDDIYRVLIKLLSIDEPNVELNKVRKSNIDILFNKIKDTQRNINLFEDTIPYWIEKINTLLDIYEKDEIKNLADLDDMDLRNLSLGYNIDRQKRDKLDELYNIKIRGCNSIIKNKVLKMIEKKGTIISGNIVSIDNNKIYIKNNLNVKAYLESDKESYKHFFIGDTIYTYIDDVIFIDNEINLILKNNDKYFIFRCIQNLLEELNYKDVFINSIDKQNKLFIVSITSKNLFDTDVILLNEQLNSIIKGIKVILKLK